MIGPPICEAGQNGNIGDDLGMFSRCATLFCRQIQRLRLFRFRFAFVGVAVFSLCLPARADDFLAGADFSFLSYFESLGVSYKDGGQTEDAFQILKSRGINCIRLRLFTSSASQAASDPYDYINNLTYTVPLAVRVKQAGLKFLLDYHYSDTWADPGHQAMPSAWTGLTFPQLVAQVRSYTSNSIATFQAAGAMPDYVQIGNEITSGMLWPDGQIGGGSNSWPNLRQLINAGIQGVKDAAGSSVPKIIIHIDRGGDWGGTQYFFDHLAQSPYPVTFDIIGESYYPFWHGPMSALDQCLTNAAQRYGKPVVVAETDFPWSGTTNIYGIPPTTNGQVQYVAALAQVVRGVPGNLGAGVFWWGTEYQQAGGVNGAGFELRSFFGSGSGSPVPTGDVLPVAAAYGQLAAPIKLSGTISPNGFTVAWPLSGAGLELTSATNLGPPGTWKPVTNPVVSTGAVFSATVPFDPGSAHYFRLQTN